MMPLFIEDLQAAIEAVGVEKAGIAFGLANVPWNSAEERDQFLASLTRTE